MLGVLKYSLMNATKASRPTFQAALTKNQLIGQSEMVRPRNIRDSPKREGKIKEIAKENQKANMQLSQ
jgi:hypothetical protein